MTCVTYQIRFIRQAQKDLEQLSPKSEYPLKAKLKDILRHKVASDAVLSSNP